MVTCNSAEIPTRQVIFLTVDQVQFKYKYEMNSSTLLSVSTELFNNNHLFCLEHKI